MRSRSLPLLLTLLATPAGAVERAHPTPLGPLELLGELRLSPGTQMVGTEFGGLSSLQYDARAGVYRALSDSERGPARWYTFRLGLPAAPGQPLVPRWLGATLLQQSSEWPFDAEEIDSEGFAQVGTEFYVGTEPRLRQEPRSLPWIRRFDPNGAVVAELPLPAHFVPTLTAAAAGASPRGMRHNQGFEALAATPDGRYLFAAAEGPLAQDGAEAGVKNGAMVRVLRYDLAAGKLDREVVVPIDPLFAAPPTPEALGINGLVDLVALDRDTLLTLERGFVKGVGHAIRLYRVNLAVATDVRAVPALVDAEGRPATRYRVAEKTGVFDFKALGVELDNLEGMTFGPYLADGRRTLVVLSDDNFADHQVTQILVFALGSPGGPIPQLQGAGHVAPRAGQFVSGVTGVVTAVEGRGAEPGFWLQDERGDGDPATADGLFVATVGASGVQAGDRVRLDGRLEERAAARGLPVTTLVDPRLTVLASGIPLPAPVRLGAGGLHVPSGAVDDDRLVRFEPHQDAIDFWEALEAMRVIVADPVVVGPLSEHGELVVLANGGAGSSPRTSRGGVQADGEDVNPERVVVDGRLHKLPRSAVGGRFTGPLVGVVHYAFANYRVVVSEPPPPLAPGDLAPETTSLGPAPDRLTLASYNVLNLDPTDPPAKYAALAQAITRNLQAPAVVALQEVQDDSGPADDGTVSAAKNLAQLVAAIVAAGGPRYEVFCLDPVNGQEGGEPVGNIRVAFLLDPARVRRVPGGRFERVGLGGPGFSDSRRSLALEVEALGERWLLINNHWVSKGGDDRLFGQPQPPVRHSETQRRQQAAAIGAYVDAARAANPSLRVVVLGDLNEHDGRPPLTDLTANGRLVDLIAGLPRAERYTYVFEGNSQVLDHILVSPELAKGAEIDVVHLHAEFPQDDAASDHEPVVVRVGAGQ